ncbi:MAG: hypothetical protein VCA36_03060 [Opitutales bacterium]
MRLKVERPQTMRQVAEESESLEEFGFLLRDWIHFLTRGDVTNRPALAQTIREEPPLLAKKLEQGEVADAYLAAYAEWIADRAKVERPRWVSGAKRTLRDPWFADEARASLLVLTPASFRQRGVYTVPEEVVRLRRGRPRVSGEQKREKARARDRRYRENIRAKLKKLKEREVGSAEGKAEIRNTKS